MILDPHCTLKIVENIIAIIVVRFQELNLEQSPLSLSPSIIESPLVKSLTLPKTLTELWHKSSQPTTEKSTSYQESTRLADTNISIPKESGIPIQTFYGTSQTQNKQNKASTVPKLQFAQYSEDEPLSKYGRRHKKGRIIRKKRAFSTLQPYNFTTPALENESPAVDTNRQPSTKSDTETLEKTDGNNNNLTEAACEITEPQNVGPKRRALSPLNTNYYLNEDLHTRDLFKKSTSQEPTSFVANINLSSPKESGIPLHIFYGTSQTKNKPNKTSSLPQLQLAQYSEDEPLSKYCRRPKKGSIIHKKRAFYSLQPNIFTTPALENTVLAMDTNSQTSMPLTKSDKESLKKTNSNKTDSNNNSDSNNNNDSNKNNNNNLTKPPCEITTLQIVLPNRQALSPKNTYVDYLDVDTRTRDLLIKAQILKHPKLKNEKKNITKEPEDEKSNQKSLLDPPTVPTRKLLPGEEPIEIIELDYQDAKSSASEDSTLNNVPTSGKSARNKPLKGNYQAYYKLFHKQVVQWGLEY